MRLLFDVVTDDRGASKLAQSRDFMFLLHILDSRKCGFFGRITILQGHYENQCIHAVT